MPVSPDSPDGLAGNARSRRFRVSSDSVCAIETGQWLRLDAVGFAITSERQNEGRFFAPHFAHFTVSEIHPNNGGTDVSFDNFTGDLLRWINRFLANRNRLDVEPFGRLGQQGQTLQVRPLDFGNRSGFNFLCRLCLRRHAAHELNADGNEYQNQPERDVFHVGGWKTQGRVEPKSKSCSGATQRRSFSLRAMLAQKLDDLLIALFHRLIQRRFPVRVLRVHVRFLIQQQFYHLLFAANDSLVQKGNVLVILCVGVRAAIQQSFGRRHVAMDHRQPQRRPTILLDLDVHVLLCSPATILPRRSWLNVAAQCKGVNPSPSNKFTSAFSARSNSITFV